MTLEEFNKNHKTLSKKEVLDFVASHQHEDLPTNTLGIIFERIFIDPKTGQTSGEVPVTRIRALHHSFEITNGNSWGRRDGGCYLGRKYNIVNHKEGRRIVSISANGFRTKPFAPTTKKIEISALEKLKAKGDECKKVTSALIVCSSPFPTAVSGTTKKEIEQKRDDLIFEMLHIINQMTNDI